MKLFAVCVFIAVHGASTVSATAQSSIVILDAAGLSDGGDYGWSLSDDGSVATGQGWGSNYWTRESGLMTASSVLYAVSGDGSTFVGSSAAIGGTARARWRAGGMVRGTGAPAGAATGVSRDGSIVSVFGSVNRAWRPDSGVTVALAPGTSGGFYAAAVSADGRFVVGEQSTVAGQSCRWDTSTGALQALGSFTSAQTGTINVWPRAVSADGSVVVGIGRSSGPPLRWTQGTGWQALPSFGSPSSGHKALGVSGDGDRVVGITGTGAFIWFAPGSSTPSNVPTGTHNLNVLLPQLGVDLTGVTLNSAKGISADGSTITGRCTLTGPLQRTYIATIQPPRCPTDLDSVNADGRPDGAVDINDLLRFLIEFENGGSRADLDNDGAAPRIADGSVDINDLLYFLARFEAGC